MAATRMPTLTDFLLFPLLCHLAYEVVPPTFSEDFLKLVNALWKHPNRHTQWYTLLISLGCTQSRKFIIKVSHYNVFPYYSFVHIFFFHGSILVGCFSLGISPHYPIYSHSSLVSLQFLWNQL